MGTVSSIIMELEVRRLFEACKDGEDVTVRCIIAGQYADLNTKDEAGNTPLHHAVYNNHPGIVSTLLDNTDVDLTTKSDHNGGTGLHGACYFNFVPLIKMFASHQRCTPEILNMK